MDESIETTHLNDTNADENAAQNEVTRTPAIITSTVLEILRSGYLQQEAKPEAYIAGRQYFSQIQEILEPLDLRLIVDERRGLLMVATYDESRNDANLEAAWNHPLVRRQRLTLEQSLLLALLRRHFLLHEQDKGIGMGEVRVDVVDLVNEMMTFLMDSGSDQNNTRRIHTLIEQLKDHGVVTSPNEHGEVTVRPLIVHLANPENLRALLDQYEGLANSKSQA